MSGFWTELGERSCFEVSGKLIPSMNPLKTSIFALLGYELACHKLKRLERTARLQADLGNNCLTRGKSQIFIIAFRVFAQFVSGTMESTQVFIVLGNLIQACFCHDGGKAFEDHAKSANASMFRLVQLVRLQ